MIILLPVDFNLHMKQITADVQNFISFEKYSLVPPNAN